MSHQESAGVQVQQYIEEIVSLQRTMEEPQRRIQDLRHAARTDGLNIPALDFLTSCISRSPSDYGARLLNPLFQYAQLLGTTIDGLPPVTIGELEARESQNMEESDRSTILPLTRRSPFWRIITFQLSVGLAISFMLLSFLH
ncbi:MAG: hypothetical protein MN733_40110 [Nitrososphaera sp.]|nr:hypothetical protein [Nitrososphaera sp.]